MSKEKAARVISPKGRKADINVSPSLSVSTDSDVRYQVSAFPPTYPLFSAIVYHHVEPARERERRLQLSLMNFRWKRERKKLRARKKIELEYLPLPLPVSFA